MLKAESSVQIFYLLYVLDTTLEDMTTHSSILAWRISWTEKPGRLPSIELQTVVHDWSDLACTHAWHNFCFFWDQFVWPLTYSVNFFCSQVVWSERQVFCSRSLLSALTQAQFPGSAVSFPLWAWLILTEHSAVKNDEPSGSSCLCSSFSVICFMNVCSGGIFLHASPSSSALL